MSRSPGFEAIAKFIDRLDQAAAGFNAVQAQRTLTEVQEIQADLGDLVTKLSAIITAALPEGRGGTFTLVDTDTGESATVKKAAKAKKYEWEDDRLLAAVIARGFDARALDDDGIPTEREGDAVARTLAAVWNLSGKTARTGALKTLGIDPDHYRDELRPDTPSITTAA